MKSPKSLKSLIRHYPPQHGFENLCKARRRAREAGVKHNGKPRTSRTLRTGTTAATEEKMPAKSKAKAAQPVKSSRAHESSVPAGEGGQKEVADRKKLLAGAILAPAVRHGITASHLHKAQFGGEEDSPGFNDYADYVAKAGDQASKGNLALANRLLAAQALTLDNMFTEMARRMALNMGEYLGATET
jgi:hypothetical protein